METTPPTKSPSTLSDAAQQATPAQLAILLDIAIQVWQESDHGRPPRRISMSPTTAMNAEAGLYTATTPLPPLSHPRMVGASFFTPPSVGSGLMVEFREIVRL